MTMEQINQQYEKVAAQIGDAQYKIRQLNALIETLYAQADALNKAASELAAPKSEPEAEAAQKAETAQKTEPVKEAQKNNEASNG